MFSTLKHHGNSLQRWIDMRTSFQSRHIPYLFSFNLTHKLQRQHLVILTKKTAFDLGGMRSCMVYVRWSVFSLNLRSKRGLGKFTEKIPKSFACQKFEDREGKHMHRYGAEGIKVRKRRGNWFPNPSPKANERKLRAQEPYLDLETLRKECFDSAAKNGFVHHLDHSSLCSSMPSFIFTRRNRNVTTVE